MSSLLSPFHFGQKHSFFHVEITIHELTNVPLVAGTFSCKWRIKGSHSLHSLQNSAASSVSLSAHHHSHHSNGHSHIHHSDSSHNPTHHPSLPDSSRSTKKNANSSDSTLSSPNLSLLAPGSSSATLDQLRAPSPTKSNSLLSSLSLGRTLQHRTSRSTIGSVSSSLRHRLDEPDVKPKSESNGHGFFSDVVGVLKGKSRKQQTDQPTYPDVKIDSVSSSNPTSSPPAEPNHQLKPSRIFSRRLTNIPNLEITTHNSPESYCQDGSLASGNTSIPSSKPVESKKASNTKRSNKIASDHPHDPDTPADPDRNTDALLFFHQEPKGETGFVRVKQHVVKWNKTIHSGLRVAIEKPKPTNNPAASSASSSHHEQRSMSERTSTKDLRARRDKDGLSELHTSSKHASDVAKHQWGMLSNSELKISIKQEIPSSKSVDQPNRLGYAILNLAEYAPDPPNSSSPSSSHHHHHHQHGLNSPSPRSTRSETLRYLLRESKTNATLKLTITMTYLGGSREYNAPPLTNGLLVSGLAQMVEASVAKMEKKRHQHRDNEPSSNSSEDNSSRKETLDITSASANQGQHASSNGPSASSLSLPHFPSHGNQNFYGPPLKSAYTKKKKSSRIPSHHFLSDKPSSQASAQRNVNDRLAFSFSGAAHLDRAPEDIVEAIFSGLSGGANRTGNSNSSNLAMNHLLTASVNRTEKIRRNGQTAVPSSVAVSNKTVARPRTQSTTSNFSKKSERTFSWKKEKPKDKDHSNPKQADDAVSITSSTQGFKRSLFGRNSYSDTQLEMVNTGQLTPPGSATIESLFIPNMKRTSTIRWELDRVDKGIEDIRV